MDENGIIPFCRTGTTWGETKSVCCTDAGAGAYAYADAMADAGADAVVRKWQDVFKQSMLYLIDSHRSFIHYLDL